MNRWRAGLVFLPDTMHAQAQGQPKTDSGRLRGLLSVLVVVALGWAYLYFVVLPVGAPPGWGSDFEAAIAEAGSTGKPVVVAFYADGCPPCKMMDRSVLPSRRVRDVIADFVPVRVDAWKELDLTERYDVVFTPTYAILDRAGNLIARTDGYHSVDEFVAFLRAGAAAVTNQPS